MTDTQRSLILILKSAITGEPCVLPEGFRLKDPAALAKKHHILPLFYTGAACCGVPANDPLMQRIFQDYLRALLYGEGQLKQIERISRAFQQEGIDFLPLKGCNLKPLYPKQELRPMGDADILIRMEQYDKIRPIMEGLGFTEKDESDHELIWEHPALHLELHKRIIPSYDRDFYACFGDGWDRAKSVEGSRYVMKAEDEYLYLFTHFSKHYRYGGIGCRHVLDLWIWRRTYPHMDEDYIRRQLEILHLSIFHENILRLIDHWFGNGDSDAITEHLTDFIMSCGSWGHADLMYQSMVLRDSQDQGSVRRNNFFSILRMLCPPADVLCLRYPVLNRLPWLLPVFWPVRWITALLFRRHHIRDEQKFRKTISVEQVKTREAALKAVGLAFHF